MSDSSNLCPCQSGQTYTQCCRPWHDGKAAPTAEALMRSRYSAYVLQLGNYLHRTWHSSTRPNKKSLLSLPKTDWQGLEIIRSEQGGKEDAQGLVEFKAHYAEAGTPQILHETSRFSRENGRWTYVDGDLN